MGIWDKVSSSDLSAEGYDRLKAVMSSDRSKQWREKIRSGETRTPGCYPLLSNDVQVVSSEASVSFYDWEADEERTLATGSIREVVRTKSEPTLGSQFGVFDIEQEAKDEDESNPIENTRVIAQVGRVGLSWEQIGKQPAAFLTATEEILN